jgi:hypothetical protein
LEEKVMPSRDEALPNIYSELVRIGHLLERIANAMESLATRAEKQPVSMEDSAAASRAVNAGYTG